MAPAQVARATVVGSLPIALVYALVGAAVAGSAARHAAFGACLGLAALMLTWQMRAARGRRA